MVHQFCFYNSVGNPRYIFGKVNLVRLFIKRRTFSLNSNNDNNNKLTWLYLFISNHHNHNVASYCREVHIDSWFSFTGMLGSLFSLLQFISSPITGALSDVYGRKPVLIATFVSIIHLHRSFVIFVKDSYLVEESFSSYIATRYLTLGYYATLYYWYKSG